MSPVFCFGLLCCALILSSDLQAAPLLPQDSNTKTLKVCSTAEECLNRALVNLKEGKREEAIDILKRTYAGFPSDPWSHRALFLMAYQALEQGSEEAPHLLNAAVGALPLLADYALFSEGDYFLKRQDYQGAINSLVPLVILYPDSILVPRALFGLGEAYYRVEEYARALEALTRLVNHWPQDDRVPQARIRMAEASQQMGLKEEAVRFLKEVWLRFPESDEARAAEEQLKGFAALGDRQAQFVGEERLERGKNLSARGQYDLAVRELNALLLNLPREERSLRKTLLFKIGVGQAQGGRYGDAKGSLAQFIREFPKDEQIPDALAWLGRIYIRLRDEQGILDLEKRLRRFKQKDQMPGVLMALALHYEDQNLFSKAEGYYKRLITHHPGDSLASEAVWKLAWLHYQQGNYRKVVESLDRYSKIVDLGSYLPQTLYWRGRSLENLRKLRETIPLYEKICKEFEHSYYCHQARRRMLSLQAQGDGEFAITPIPMTMEAPLEGSPSEAEDTLAQDEHFRKYGELMILGFEEEAVEELVHLSTRYARDLPSTLRINEEFIRIGDYYRSLTNLRQNFSSFLERGEPGVSERFWQQAYPLGFFESIETEARRNGIDPFLVAAVIREESGFNPEAISRTGALGLMQVMPYTGEWIATKINQEGYEPEHLFHSEMNIRFGTWYLAHLAQKFDGNLYRTAAAYNAGPEAVSKWLSEGSSREDDEFVESIPFRETRFFVKRVLRSYHEYHHIHDPTLGTPPASSASNLSAYHRGSPRPRPRPSPWSLPLSLARLAGQTPTSSARGYLLGARVTQESASSGFTDSS